MSTNLATTAPFSARSVSRHLVTARPAQHAQRAVGNQLVAALLAHWARNWALSNITKGETDIVRCGVCDAAGAAHSANQHGVAGRRGLP